MEIAPNDSAMDDLVQEAICIAWSKYLSRKLKRDIEPRLAVLYSVRDACRDLLEGKRFVADYELQTDDYSDVSSKRDRAIMLLHGNHGLSKVEIAKRIGCSTRTVFLAIRRVRQMREFA